jgi:hypothetical protein
LSEVDSTVLEQLRSENDIVIIAYLDGEDATARENFTAIAEELKDEHLFSIVTRSSSDEVEISTSNVVVYNATEGTTSSFGLIGDRSSLTKSIKEAVTPLVAEIHPETHRHYLQVT